MGRRSAVNRQFGGKMWMAALVIAMAGVAGCTGKSIYSDKPVVLSQYVADGFERYKGEQGPHQFAVSENGKAYFYVYCGGTACSRSLGTDYTIGRCQQRSGGEPCKIFAIGKEIKWRGKITWPGEARAARAARNQVSARASGEPVPVVIRWEGAEDDLEASMWTTGDGGHGQIHTVDKSGGKCDGTWVYKSGKYAAGGPVKGTWLISCANGVIAFGDYINSAPLKGTATGKDTKGRKVVITYGE